MNKLKDLLNVLKGGSGSGNFGHSGRKGKRGGSAPKGSFSSNQLLDGLKQSGFRVNKITSNAARVGLNRPVTTMEVETVLENKFPTKKFNVSKLGEDALVMW